MSASSMSAPQNAKEIGSPIVGCSKHPYKFCDVAGLVIIDNGSARRVRACLPAEREEARDAARRKAASGKHGLIDGADAVLEILSAFKTDKEEVRSKSNVAITVQYAEACDGAKHPMIVFNPAGPRPFTSPPVAQAGSSLSVRLVAEPDASTVGPATIRQQIVDYVWPFNKLPAVYYIQAQSCGQPSKGKPVATLSAWLLVYRKEIFALELHIPAFHGFKQEYAAVWDTKGKVTKTGTSTQTQFGETVKVDERKKVSEAGGAFSVAIKTRRADGEKSVEKTLEAGSDADGNFYRKKTVKEDETTTKGVSVAGSKLPLFTTTKTVKTLASNKVSDANKSSDPEISRNFKFEPEFSLKRNDQELPLTEFVNSVLNIYTRLTEAWNSIKEFVPQVGFKASLDIKICEGTASIKYGLRNVPSPGPHYALVERFLEGSIEVKLLEVAVDASFGVELKVPSLREKLLKLKGTDPWFHLIAKISAKLVLNASITSTLTLAESGRAFEPKKVESKNTANLTAEYLINVAGFKLEHAKVDVAAGLTFEGELKGDLTDGVRVEGKLVRNAVVLTVYFKSDLEQSPDIDAETETLTLWEAKTIKDPFVISFCGSKHG